MYKDLKNNIINTSYQSFMENGYAQTTVNDICKACSITKTTFYRYIDSKEELLSYFFDDINERIDELRTNAKIHQNYVQQIIDAFDLIIEHMLQFKQELYCQLYISNLKENKGTFSQINDLKEIVVELIEKAQTTKEIKNPSSPQIIYNVLEHICFGCGIQWCLHQIEDVRLEFIQSLKAILIA